MSPDIESAENNSHLRHILLVTAIIFIPGILGALFGWIHMLLPLLIFYYLIQFGKKRGTKYIMFGCCIAGIAGLAFGVLEELLFAMTLIPTGFMLAESVRVEDSIFTAGMKGTLALAGTWFVVALVLSMGMEHPYTMLLRSIDQGMDSALEYYRSNSEVPAETLYVLQGTFSRMKIWMPRVLPGILGCIMLLIIWVTMVSGNRLLFKKTGSRPWPEYRFWVLPDKLVWALIASVALLLTRNTTLQTLGVNIMLLSGLLYCFQGLSVMLFMFCKWSVPVFVRSIIYVVLFFQSFGAIFLAVIGVIDVWADVRKLNTRQETD